MGVADLKYPAGYTIEVVREVLVCILVILGLHQVYGQDGNLIKLTPIGSGFSQPIDIANAGDDRLFIVERTGEIRIMDLTGETNPTSFLDIGDRISTSGGERGLLGLVFHPDYADNGYFFVNYTNLSGNTTISRFTRSNTGPDLADAGSEKVLLTISQPFGNHNAGDMAFGPDRYLYFGTGDGGSAGDPGNRAQNRQNLLGKMLRIDVDSGDPYSIPPDNPFAEDDFTLDEIWALGLRNPWRFSFDRTSGDLWIADVGQDAWEEINIQSADSPGGENYGWRCYEADSEFNLLNCPDMEEMTFPIYKYAHVGLNCSGSVTGGFVYRGVSNPDLAGWYIFVDYCKGVFRGIRLMDQEVESQVIYQGQPFAYTTFGEDLDGELYVATSSGDIFRVDQTATSVSGVATNSWKLIPNPSNGHFSMESGDMDAMANLFVTVYDVSGRSMTVNRNGSNFEVVSMSPGVYFVLLKSNGVAEMITMIIR